VVTYDLLFRRWPRLEIDRIVSEVTAGLTVADSKCYINVAKFCKLVSLVNEGELPSVQPFASSFGRRIDSHDQLRD
jgi:hypothetical protein